MPSAKKRFFKHTKKTIGDNSVKPREKKAIKADLSVRIPSPKKVPAEDRSYSPNIYRFIADRISGIHQKKTGAEQERSGTVQKGRGDVFSWKRGIAIFLGIVFIGVFLCEALLFWQLGKKMVQIFLQRQELVQNMMLWEGIAKKYPMYRDAYFQAAILAYELGDDQKKNQYLQKVFLLDPTYEPAKKLQGLW